MGSGPAARLGEPEFDLQNLREQKASVVELLLSQRGGGGHTGSCRGSLASEPNLIDEL